MEGERVRNMRSDCEVVMDTYVDCFLYLLSHLKLSDPERGVFQEDLAKMVSEVPNVHLILCVCVCVCVFCVCVCVAKW